MAITEILTLAAATGTGPTALFDDDAIKKLIVNPLVDTLWTTTDLDGGYLTVPLERAVTITTSPAAVGAHTVDRYFEVSGLDAAGNHITASIKLTNVNGGETVETPIGFHTVTSIFVPAQVLNTGAIKVGIGSVILATPAQAIEVGTAGVVKLGTVRGRSDVTLPANAVREIAVTYIDRTNATFPLTLFR